MYSATIARVRTGVKLGAWRTAPTRVDCGHPGAFFGGPGGAALLQNALQQAGFLRCIALWHEIGRSDNPACRKHLRHHGAWCEMDRVGGHGRYGTGTMHRNALQCQALRRRAKNRASTCEAEDAPAVCRSVSLILAQKNVCVPAETAVPHFAFLSGFLS